MSATSPRLRRFRFTAGQAVLLGGDLPALVRGRLRTEAGRALYHIELTGETAGRPFRTVMEDGLVEVPERSAKTARRRFYSFCRAEDAVIAAGGSRSPMRLISAALRRLRSNTYAARPMAAGIAWRTSRWPARPATTGEVA